MYKNVLVPVDLAHQEQAGAMIQNALAIMSPDAKLTLCFAMPEIPAVLGLQMPEGSAELVNDRHQCSPVSFTTHPRLPGCSRSLRLRPDPSGFAYPAAA